MEERLAAVRAIEEEKAERATREQQRRHDRDAPRGRRSADEDGIDEEEERERDDAEVRDVVVARSVLRATERGAEARADLHDAAREEPNERDHDREAEADDVGRKRTTDAVRDGGEADDRSREPERDHVSARVEALERARSERRERSAEDAAEAGQDDDPGAFVDPAE